MAAGLVKWRLCIFTHKKLFLLHDVLRCVLDGLPAHISGRTRLLAPLSGREKHRKSVSGVLIHDVQHGAVSVIENLLEDLY